MEVIGIIGLVLFCWIVIRLLDFTISANAKKRKESESKTDFPLQRQNINLTMNLIVTEFLN